MAKVPHAGRKFFPFRINLFSEEGKLNFDRVITLEGVSSSLKIHVKVVKYSITSMA